MIHIIAHAIVCVMGLNNGSGAAYLFWSGFGSDLAYLGAISFAWHHLNCHAKGCYRIGRHPVSGTPFKTCRKHHPEIDGRTSAADIKEASNA